jgi:hypothetical protein
MMAISSGLPTEEALVEVGILALVVQQDLLRHKLELRF